MPKFNSRRGATGAQINLRRPARSPVATLSPPGPGARPDAHTALGAPGFTRDAQSELMLLGLANMVGAKTFHEHSDARDDRFTSLICHVAVNDPAWIAGFLPWLRTVANMRTAPVVGAVQAGRALAGAKMPGASTLVDSVLRRPDQPGEALAYWAVTHNSRVFPDWLRRGCARAAVRMYTQRSAIRWDTDAAAYRMGRVVQLCHPKPRDREQADLFRALIDRAYHRNDPRIEGLAMLRRDELLRRDAQADPSALLAPGRLAGAGWVFQDALPYAGERVSKREIWQAVIDQMGLHALVTNLRGFDDAQVGGAAIDLVKDKLTDRATVRRSQMFPFRFYQAFDNLASVRWHEALETALGFACQNIPELPGRSLVLVDTSASMTNQNLSDKSTMTAAKAAALFGCALAARHHPSRVDLVGFADGTFVHPIRPGASVLAETQRFLARTGDVGHGTRIPEALKATYRAHDRVFLISDMQSCTGYSAGLVPASVPVYGVNLSGYATAYMPTGGGNRHEIGGLSDAMFTLVPILESGNSAPWPWMIEHAAQVDADD